MSPTSTKRFRDALVAEARRAAAANLSILRLILCGACGFDHTIESNGSVKHAETMAAAEPPTPRSKPEATHGSWATGTGLLGRVRQLLELLSFLAIVIGAPIAIIQYRDSIENQQEALAEKVYRDVDERYTDYLKLCLANPRLDGYSVPLGEPCPPLSEDEKLQQKLLYTILTDVFEVAYVQYHKTEAVKERIRTRFYEQQWPGWETYIRKFMSRLAYRTVWREIGDEYDKDFRDYMDKIASSYEKR